MRIEIIDQISETITESWVFTIMETSAVFVYWNMQEKPKGKRKLRTLLFWDKYDERRSNSFEPTLTDEIREKAYSELIKYVSVKTWSEWKGK